VPLRLRLAFLLVVAATCAVAVLAFVALSRSPRAGTKQLTGAVRPPDLPLPTFRLRDQDGRAVDLTAFRGRPVVVTFLYTHCRDTCPLTAQQVRGGLDLLGHDVPALAVSVDPSGDTPARARAFLSREHVSGRMRFLLGSSAQLQRVWRTFGVSGQSPEQEHSVSLVLLDRAGRQRVGFGVDDLTADAIAHDLRLLEGEKSG